MTSLSKRVVMLDKDTLTVLLTNVKRALSYKINQDLAPAYAPQFSDERLKKFADFCLTSLTHSKRIPIDLEMLEVLLYYSQLLYEDGKWGKSFLDLVKKIEEKTGVYWNFTYCVFENKKMEGDKIRCWINSVAEKLSSR